MRYFVTGGAGFIGTNLVEKLLSEGGEVVAYDNLSTGRKRHLDAFLTNPRFTFLEGDVLDASALTEAIARADVVFQLAANSDIRYAAANPDVELQQSIVATFNVLKAMHHNSVSNIVFTSSSTIYGDLGERVLPEDFGPPMPISFYGAGKLAGEGLISSFCHMCDMKGWIFRFANIVGTHLTHGVIFDFIRKLRKDPSQLEILGNGKQTKPYLHVTECVGGMLWGLRNSDQEVSIFNLSPPDAISVDEIARTVVEEMGLKNVAFTYTGGEGGWKGDVPRFRLDGGRLRKLGWQPTMSSGDAVRRAVREALSENDAFR
jgi:UDP-glucose 4-epimerase